MMANNYRRNERLGHAMGGAGVTFAELAELVGTHPKTAQRWFYEGRRPHRKTALNVARMLGVDALWLWSAPLSDREPVPGLICLYAGVEDIPTGLWQRLAITACDGIDIAVSVADEQVLAAIAAILSGRAALGVRVRLCASDAGLAENLPGVEARSLDHPLAMSIFRFDEAMLVRMHGPQRVLRLCQTDGGVFDVYAHAFEALWSQGAAQPSP